MEKRKLLANEELTRLFDRTLEILHAQRLKNVGGNGERYQMFANWYNRVNNIQLEIAGVLGFTYHNPAADEW